MYEKFEELLKRHNVTPYRVAKETGITTATFTSWKQGKYTPKQDKLQKIADFFDVPLSYFTSIDGHQGDVPYFTIKEKDEKDIAKQMEKMIVDLGSDEALAFNGDPMDEETRRLFLISLEHSYRLAKELAKKKFTPKKYRN